MTLLENNNEKIMRNTFITILFSCLLVVALAALVTSGEVTEGNNHTKEEAKLSHVQKDVEKKISEEKETEEEEEEEEVEEDEEDDENEEGEENEEEEIEIDQEDDHDADNEDAYEEEEEESGTNE